MYEIKNKNKIIVLIQYLIGYLVVYPILLGFLASFAYKIIGVDISYGIQLVFYVAFLLYFCYLCKPLLLEMKVSLKERFGSILKITGKNVLYSYLLNYVINMFLLYFTSQTSSANQVNIESQLSSTPLLIAFVAVIFAPFVEEFVFRGVIYKHIEERKGFWIAALVSSFLFGGMHVFFSIFSLNFVDLLFAFPYMVQGFMIAKNYRDTQSFAGAWMFHFINNFVAVAVLLLLG